MAQESNGVLVRKVNCLTCSACKITPKVTNKS